MSDLVVDEAAEASSPNTAFERAAARQLVRFANATSRRSFLGWIGRASLAIMGGSFLNIWMAESAFAGPCLQSNGPFPKTGRSSCMCLEVSPFQNVCDGCCSGFWRACPMKTADPAACFASCPGGLIKFFRVRLWDCCAQCSSQADPSKAGCSSFGNDWCNISATAGYCDDGGCCSGTGCNTWRVKCVVKECITSDICRGCA